MVSKPFSGVVEKSDVEPEPMTIPLVLPTEDPSVNLIPIRYSYYQPWLGGTNCSNFVNGACISNMASGKPWLPYMEYAIACPPEWSFGMKIKAYGSVWECMDRGGAIKFVDGIPWIDFLTEYPRAPYRSIQYVELIN